MAEVSINYERARAPLAEQLTDTTILVVLSQPVVVNSAYYEPAAYEVAVYDYDVDDYVPIGVRSVLLTKARTTSQIVLVVDGLLEGRAYRVSSQTTVAPWTLPDGGVDYIGDPPVDVPLATYPVMLQTPGGDALTFSTLMTARKTKAAAMLRHIPAHFNRAPNGVMASVLTAIGLQDEQIGGSRADSVSAGTEDLTPDPGP
jgi:hypothetical protein